MRLFIAIPLADETRSTVMDTAARLQPHLLQGRFSPRDNLHLTLAFLGETPPSRVQDVRTAMDSVSPSPFSLHIGTPGRFRRPGGDILWLSVDGGAPLRVLYTQLSAALRLAGFALEARAFSPHLTIGRQIVLNPHFDLAAFGRTVHTITDQAACISLMRSDRIGGKLTYTELYRRDIG